MRLAPQAQLVVRVNGRQVASLGLPAGRDKVALRVRLGKDGRLTIARPSGQILDVPACST